MVCVFLLLIMFFISLFDIILLKTNKQKKEPGHARSDQSVRGVLQDESGHGPDFLEKCLVPVVILGTLDLHFGAGERAVPFLI